MLKFAFRSVMGIDNLNLSIVFSIVLMNIFSQGEVMKKFILLSGLLLATTSFADQLHNYNDITAAITNGKSLHIVTNLSQCTTTAKRATTTMSVGSFTPNEIAVTDSHIATAMTHFTLNNPFFPGKPVYEFVRYTITPDNTMAVTVDMLDAPSYAKLKDPMTFNCTLDGAAKIYV